MGFVHLALHDRERLHLPMVFLCVFHVPRESLYDVSIFVFGYVSFTDICYDFRYFFTDAKHSGVHQDVSAEQNYTALRTSFRGGPLWRFV